MTSERTKEEEDPWTSFINEDIILFAPTSILALIYLENNNETEPIKYRIDHLIKVTMRNHNSAWLTFYNPPEPSQPLNDDLSRTFVLDLAACIIKEYEEINEQQQYTLIRYHYQRFHEEISFDIVIHPDALILPSSTTSLTDASNGQIKTSDKQLHKFGHQNIQAFDFLLGQFTWKVTRQQLSSTSSSTITYQAMNKESNHNPNLIAKGLEESGNIIRSILKNSGAYTGHTIRYLGYQYTNLMAPKDKSDHSSSKLEGSKDGNAVQQASKSLSPDSNSSNLSVIQSTTSPSSPLPSTALTASSPSSSIATTTTSKTSKEIDPKLIEKAHSYKQWAEHVHSGARTLTGAALYPVRWTGRKASEWAQGGSDRPESIPSHSSTASSHVTKAMVDTVTGFGNGVVSICKGITEAMTEVGSAIGDSAIHHAKTCHGDQYAKEVTQCYVDAASELGLASYKVANVVAFGVGGLVIDAMIEGTVLLLALYEYLIGPVLMQGYMMMVHLPLVTPQLFYVVLRPWSIAFYHSSKDFVKKPYKIIPTAMLDTMPKLRIRKEMKEQMTKSVDGLMEMELETIDEEKILSTFERSMDLQEWLSMQQHTGVDLTSNIDDNEMKNMTDDAELQDFDLIQLQQPMEIPSTETSKASNPSDSSNSSHIKAKTPSSTTQEDASTPLPSAPLPPASPLPTTTTSNISDSQNTPPPKPPKPPTTSKKTFPFSLKAMQDIFNHWHGGNTSHIEICTVDCSTFLLYPLDNDIVSWYHELQLASQRVETIAKHKSGAEELALQRRMALLPKDILLSITCHRFLSLSKASNGLLSPWIKSKTTSESYAQRMKQNEEELNKRNIGEIELEEIPEATFYYQLEGEEVTVEEEEENKEITEENSSDQWSNQIHTTSTPLKDQEKSMSQEKINHEKVSEFSIQGKEIFSQDNNNDKSLDDILDIQDDYFGMVEAEEITFVPSVKESTSNTPSNTSSLLTSMLSFSQSLTPTKSTSSTFTQPNKPTHHHHSRSLQIKIIPKTSHGILLPNDTCLSRFTPFQPLFQHLQIISDQLTTSLSETSTSSSSTSTSTLSSHQCKLQEHINLYQHIDSHKMIADWEYGSFQSSLQTNNNTSTPTNITTTNSMKPMILGTQTSLSSPEISSLYISIYSTSMFTSSVYEFGNGEIDWKDLSSESKDILQQGIWVPIFTPNKQRKQLGSILLSFELIHDSLKQL